MFEIGVTGTQYFCTQGSVRVTDNKQTKLDHGKDIGISSNNQSNKSSKQN